MSILRINGGQRLDGVINVHGAKNSVLPILAASILSKSETVIRNCPDLTDVNAAIKILRRLGCKVTREGDTVCVDSREMTRCDISDKLMREMRSSVIFLGAILARAGEAVLSMPGGCELGPRPIDMHLSALRALGAEITEQNGNIVCKGKQLRGCRIDLAIPSVGATENSMLAATCARGTTVITNAAREPEIWDLQRYLNKIGARVYGAGTSIITVEGCDFGYSAEHRVIPDRIVSATYLCCAAMAGGRVKVTGVMPRHLETVTDALSEMGCVVITGDNEIYIRAEDKLKAIKPVITRPYPGFPTDAQPPLMAVCLKAEGTTAFVENIFQNRYRHVSELKLMGADIRVEDRIAMVSGVKKLSAAPVTSTDLRGGAALVVAALGAEGVSEISELHHIDRGYERIEAALGSVGARIERVAQATD